MGLWYLVGGSERKVAVAMRLATVSAQGPTTLTDEDVAVLTPA